MERVIALLVALACLVLLGRLALGPSRRARLDRAVRQRWQAWRWHLRGWTTSRAARQEAERAAREAIERARRVQAIEREGNVLKPDAFKGPRKPH